MEYTLKEKLSATKSFVDSLTEKSWQEIEHLQIQLANLTDTKDSKKVKQLLKNLLTSYYIFVGGLENLDNSSNQEPVEIHEPVANTTVMEYEPEVATENEDITIVSPTEPEFSEPFEYFVDFDEPVGEPLTDKDLYNLKMP